MYDAIVVGARCAGSPTAMLLARKGYRVLLVDKSTFPSDAPRGHFIQEAGVARLKRCGLLDQLRASNTRLSFPFASTWVIFILEGSPPPFDGVNDVTRCRPRLTVLDKLLIDAATGAGAEVREDFTVQEVLMDGEQVTGIRGHVANGVTVTERSKSSSAPWYAVAGCSSRPGSHLSCETTPDLRLLCVLERRSYPITRSLRIGAAWHLRLSD